MVHSHDREFDRAAHAGGVADVAVTAGELRVSNFLLWQGAYAEYYAAPVYWPDFDEQELYKALEAFNQRKRRYGGLPGEE